MHGTISLKYEAKLFSLYDKSSQMIDIILLANTSTNQNLTIRKWKEKYFISKSLIQSKCSHLFRKSFEEKKVKSKTKK